MPQLCSSLGVLPAQKTISRLQSGFHVMSLGALGEMTWSCLSPGLFSAQPAPLCAEHEPWGRRPSTGVTHCLGVPGASELSMARSSCPMGVTILREVPEDQEQEGGPRTLHFLVKAELPTLTADSADFLLS